MNIGERSAQPSLPQMEALVDYLKKNPALANGSLRTHGSRERCRRQWEEITLELNRMGGTVKSSKQWTKYWADKKTAIKRKCAARAAASKNGDEVVILTELEDRVVALMGGEGVCTGDAHLRIRPFQVPSPSPSRPRQESTNSDESEQLDEDQQQHDQGDQTSSSTVTTRRLFGSAEDLPEKRQHLLHKIKKIGYGSSSAPDVTAEDVTQERIYSELDAEFDREDSIPPGATSEEFILVKTAETLQETTEKNVTASDKLNAARLELVWLQIELLKKELRIKTTEHEQRMLNMRNEERRKQEFHEIAMLKLQDDDLY